MNVLEILGRYGSVRRTTPGRYRCWCPSCGHTGSLLVVTGMAGARPASCVNACAVVDVVAALKQMERGHLRTTQGATP